MIGRDVEAWLPEVAALINKRPDLAGVGLSDVLAAVVRA